MMTDDVTIPVDVAPVEIAQERRAPAPAQREVVFDIRDLDREVRARRPRSAASTSRSTAT